MPLESQGSQDTSFVVQNLPEGVKADCDPIPQPAPALPHHHAPKIPPGGRYPIVLSGNGKYFPSFTAVLFEDEEIIVWENRGPPGNQGPLHQHDHDYWIASAHDYTSREHKALVKRSDTNYKDVFLPGGGSAGGMIFVKKGHLETASRHKDAPLGVLYSVEIKKPHEGGGVPQSLPAGWGASVGVLFENTEVKISDMRVPAGQKANIARENPDNGILHMDVRGKRFGAQDVAELLDISEGTESQGGARKSFMEAYLFQKKKWGNTYYLPAGSDEPGPEGGKAGECFNNGTEEYRGVVVEVKPGKPQLTARL